MLRITGGESFTGEVGAVMSGDISVYIGVLLRSGGFVLPLTDLPCERRVFDHQLRTAAQDVSMRITSAADSRFLTVTDIDHEVTETEKSAARIVAVSVLGTSEAIPYEEALYQARRDAIAPAQG